MPSAPITTSASALSPSAKRSVWRGPRLSPAGQRLPSRTAVAGARGAARVEQVGAVRGVGVLAEELLAFRRQVFRGQHAAVLPAAELPAGLQAERAFLQRAEHA